MKFWNAIQNEENTLAYYKSKFLSTRQIIKYGGLSSLACIVILYLFFYGITIIRNKKKKVYKRTVILVFLDQYGQIKM